MTYYGANYLGLCQAVTFLTLVSVEFDLMMKGESQIFLVVDMFLIAEMKKNLKTRSNLLNLIQ